MKRIIATVIMLVAICNLSFAEKPDQIEIGEVAPNQKQVIKDVSGLELQLKTLAKENGLLVIFSCNTCPFVVAWEDRYNTIAAYCDFNNIGFVVVNSNEAKRNDADSYEAMQEKAEAMGYNFYYALDKNHELADAFGATKTPDVFLFDKNMELVYKGAIDDSKEVTDVEENYLSDAMVNMLKGAVIDPNATLAVGCTIKRIK